MKAHLDRNRMQNDGNSGVGNTIPYDTSPQPRKKKTMALTNRRQRSKKIQPPSLPDDTATPPEPTPAATPAEPMPAERDDRTILTEVAPAPGPGTGGRGRPPKEQRTSFFDGLFDYPKQEWDDGRMVLSLYRLEPYTDRTAGGPKPVWVMKYAGPVDQERILLDHGSGRYRLYLNQAEAGRRKTVLVETHEFEIFNPKFPPKIPAGEWVDDPRNKKWAWAHPSRQRQDGPLGVSDVLELVREAIRTERPELPSRGVETSDAAIKLAIAQSQGRDDLAKELATRAAAPAPQSNPLGDLKTMVEVVKTLLPQQQQPTDGLALVDRVLAMMQKLNPAPAKPEAQDPLAYVDSVLSLADRLRPAQSAPALPTGDDGSLAAVSAIIHEVAVLIKDPLLVAMQVWAASRAQNAAGALAAPARSQPQPTPVLSAPAQPGGHAQPDAAQQATTAPPTVPPPQIIALANQVTPIMLRWLLADAPPAEQGAEFAAFVADGWGFQDLKLLQDIGAAGIVDLYRHSPFWGILGPMEGKFEEFIKAFVEWQPAADVDGQRESEAGKPEVIEL